MTDPDCAPESAKSVSTSRTGSHVRGGVIYLIPLFHTGPESHELTRVDKYLDSWLNSTQFVMVLTDSHSP